jgi:hypothetical protein
MTALRNEAAGRPADPDAPVAEHAPEKDPWSHTEMLLAQLVDDVRLLRWTVVATTAGAKAPAIPEPLRRPGTAKRRRRGMTREQAARIDPRLRAVPDSTAS